MDKEERIAKEERVNKERRGRIKRSGIEREDREGG